MAQVDTSIYGSLLARPKSVEEYDAEHQRAQANQLALLLKSKKVDQMARADEQERAVSDAWRGATDPSGSVNRGNLLSALAQGGLGARIPTVQKQFADADEAAAKVDQAKSQARENNAQAGKIDWEVAVAKQAQIAQLASSATDQASWNRARIIASQLGADVSQVPEQFSPEVAQHFGQIAMTQAQRLEDMRKQQQQAETERDNKARVAATLRGQNIQAETTRRGQDITRENSIRSNERMVANAGGVVNDASSGAPASNVPLKTGSLAAKVVDAREVLDLLNDADALIGSATGSMVGNAIDSGLQAVGVSTKGAQAGAKLKAIEGLLISKMPKMTGPQSDKDVLLYKQMAGQIGDPNVPAATKKAASATIREINERYAGVPKGSSNPAQPKQLAPQDRQALDWANANPNDPRAAKIKQKLGM